MEKRKFGRSEHMSSVAIFGGAAFWNIDQAGAEEVMQLVVDAGVNHIDIAPSYGLAEERLGPIMPSIRDQFFLGEKTMERTAEGAWAEMHASLERLQTDHFDLYQLHAVTSMDELDQVMQKGGAIESLVRARDEGITKHLGITGHGLQTPSVFIEALNRFDFDSVLFPINPRMYADEAYRLIAEELIALCAQKDVGTMIIKVITRGPWGDKPKKYITWYEPFTEQKNIQLSIDFALSQNITGICTAGEPTLLPLVLEAASNFTPMPQNERETLIEDSKTQEPLFRE